MDDRRFDALTRALANGKNRRSLLKGLFGLGSATVFGSTIRHESSAARPTSVPTPKPAPTRIPTPTPVPTCPGPQIWDGSACTCLNGTTCGPDCCPAAANCCDNACCYGTCYAEELCCPTPRNWCTVSEECCPEGWSCCESAGCIAPGLCCDDGDCASCERCAENGTCIEAPELCLGCGGPGSCCSDQDCLGCHVCQDGKCVPDNNNCYIHACRASVCTEDGGCDYPLDCRNGTNCCTAQQICGQDDGICHDCAGSVCAGNAAPICCEGDTAQCCLVEGVTPTCIPSSQCCSSYDCLGCNECVDHICTRADSNCYVHECRQSVCLPSGACDYPLDCRQGTNCCAAGETCGTDGQCHS